ncbi:MAG: AEC family transporter, partial [Clostridia bacterium]|nr:AEC family transporter [Clostridia bacterium]
MFVGISSVLTILLMIGTGFFLTKKRWFDDHTAHLFSKIVINVGVPALALESITRQFSTEILKTSLIYILIAFTSIIILFLLAKIIGKLLKLEKKEKAAFCLLFAFSNAIFMGIPINKTIFGDESIIYVLLFFMASNFLFWTLGIYTMSNANSEDGSKEGLFSNMKRAVTPGLIAILTAFLLVAIDVQLPPFLARTLSYFGNLCVPLSMLFLGI